MSASSPQRKVVLLVDDGEINRKIARIMFRDFKNLELDVAENGQIAVDLIKKEKKNYDLVLMDYEMPVMNGHQAARELRELGVKVPIVAFTSRDSQYDKEQFSLAGAADFLPKPMKKAELLQLLAKYRLDQADSSEGPSR